MLRKLFLLSNYVVIIVLAVMAMVQIWFEVWDDWELFGKLLSTYIVYLLAVLALNHGERIATALFSRGEGKENKDANIVP